MAAPTQLTTGLPNPSHQPSFNLKANTYIPLLQQKMAEINSEIAAFSVKQYKVAALPNSLMNKLDEASDLNNKWRDAIKVESAEIHELLRDPTKHANHYCLNVDPAEFYQMSVQQAEFALMLNKISAILKNMHTEAKELFITINPDQKV